MVNMSWEPGYANISVIYSHDLCHRDKKKRFDFPVFGVHVLSEQRL